MLQYLESSGVLYRYMSVIDCVTVVEMGSYVCLVNLVENGPRNISCNRIKWAECFMYLVTNCIHVLMKTQILGECHAKMGMVVVYRYYVTPECKCWWCVLMSV